MFPYLIVGAIALTGLAEAGMGTKGLFVKAPPSEWASIVLLSMSVVFLQHALRQWFAIASVNEISRLAISPEKKVAIVKDLCEGGSASSKVTEGIVHILHIFTKLLGLG